MLGSQIPQGIIGSREDQTLALCAHCHRPQPKKGCSSALFEVCVDQQNHSTEYLGLLGVKLDDHEKQNSVHIFCTLYESSWWLRKLHDFLSQGGHLFELHHGWHNRNGKTVGLPLMALLAGSFCFALEGTACVRPFDGLWRNAACPV